jgi:hypothetical protein
MFHHRAQSLWVFLDTSEIVISGVCLAFDGILGLQREAMA